MVQRHQSRRLEAVAIPALTYGCEAWVLTEREKSRLQATEMRVLRKIAGVTRLDRVRTRFGYIAKP